jgi:hypothetical protein
VAEKIMLDNEHATLWYDDERGIVHHQFHRHMHGEAFRQVLNQGTALMQANGATKWLSDDRANAALKTEDSEWAQTDWFPRTMAAGWKFWALVQPEMVIGQLNMRRFTESYAKQGLTVAVFSDPARAREWLEAQ